MKRYFHVIVSIDPDESWADEDKWSGSDVAWFLENATKRLDRTVNLKVWECGESADPEPKNEGC